MIIELLTMGAKLCSTICLATDLDLGLNPGLVEENEEKKHHGSSSSINQRSGPSVHNNEVTYDCECMEIAVQLLTIPNFTYLDLTVIQFLTMDCSKLVLRFDWSSVPYDNKSIVLKQKEYEYVLGILYQRIRLIKYGKENEKEKMNSTIVSFHV